MPSDDDAAVPYKEAACAPWADAVEVPDADGVVVTGTCARCRHSTSYASRDTWTSGLAADHDPNDDQPLVLIRCDCAEYHDPGEATEPQGCGAYWRYPEPLIPGRP